MNFEYTKETLQDAVQICTSVSDVIRHFGLKVTGSRHRHVKQRIKYFNIDISHFQLTRKTWTKRTCIEDVLVKNRLRNRESSSTLREALKKIGREENCAECGQGSNWNGKPLRIQIDHIDGDGWNNTPENLRFLCPNCHSQTDTFAVKNAVRKGSKQKKIKPLKIKVEWSTKRITKEELEKLVWEKPTTLIAKDYGVSDNSVGKWCKGYKISKPPRGYWSKQNHTSVVSSS